jgi:hypothetical protein
MNCEYCAKEFSTKSSLSYHQKTAKYCLEKQGKTNEDYKCSYCEKCFTTKQRIDEHKKQSCKLKGKVDCMKEIISLKEDLNICKKQEKTKLKEKDSIYQQQLKEKDSLFQQQLKEKDSLFQQQLKEKDSLFQQQLKEKEQQLKEKDIYLSTSEKIINEKNEYIVKIETKLEKFENVVVSNMASTKLYEDEDEKDEEPLIPLGKKLDSIVIEEINEDVEYSNITLNNVVITSRPIDHYVNATQLCQAGGKKFNDWIRLDTTKELINELSPEAGIPASGLVEAKRGGNDKSKQGSWIHPDLSIQLAQWISPKFAIQVSKWIRTLFSDGSIEIDLSLMREKETEMRDKDSRIKKLESVCLSKQRRFVYPERNVIYMLTTEDHLRRRTYIIGKAKNLTNRLSTYNKTCDHTVVHYRECKNEDDMDAAEIMVLTKLRSHREQANRDRFILPDDKNESFFTHMIDECVRFLT